MPGTHCKQQNHSKRLKNVENVALNRFQKDTYIMRLKQGGRGLPCSNSTGNVSVKQLKMFTALSMSVCDHVSNIIDFGYKEIITKRKIHKDGICK